MIVEISTEIRSTPMESNLSNLAQCSWSSLLLYMLLMSMILGQEVNGQGQLEIGRAIAEYLSRFTFVCC